MRRVIVFLAALLAIVVAIPRDRHRTPPLADDGIFRAVILGDSVARGTGDESRRGIAGNLDDALAPRRAPTINLGIDGARTFVVKRLVARPSARDALRAADAVILSIGGNDLYGDSFARLLAGVWPGHQRARALAKVAGVVAEVRRVNPAAQIYVLGLYNPYRHSALAAFLDTQVNLWDAQLIERFAASRRVTVIRVCDLLDRDDRISTLDHFHPGAGGYKAIAERIAAAL